jgi:ubiquinone/menaquinone biosynthesis C-methylase UbiE
MNEAHLRICASPEWAAYVESELLPWALRETDLGDKVLEVGPGPGLTTDVLRRRVPRLTAVEIDERLASALAERMSGSNVEVVHGDGTRLPFGAGQFSAATLFTMLHHVPSAGLQDTLLAEVCRVVRPGGQLRFCEHVRADTPGLRRLQRVLDATVWPLLGGGCHVARDTLATIAGAGFTVVQSEAFVFPETRIPAPASPHVWGIATRDP